MKKEKTIVVLNYLTAVCFYIAAIIGYVNDNSMATVWLCLGSAWLCIGSLTLNKFKNKDKNDNEKK